MTKTWLPWLISADEIKVHGQKLLPNIKFMWGIDPHLDETVHSLWI